MKKYMSALYLAVISLTLSAGCAPNTQITAAPTTELKISLLYPTETTEVEMGQSLKGIIEVLDEQGEIVENAQVTLAVSDPDGNLIAGVPSAFGGGDVYRTDAWKVPHKMQAGVWTLTVEAKAGTSQGMACGTFRVNESIGEMLLSKYGFWIDSPTLRGIVPSLVKEQGNAQNGVIIWGGVLPSQHIFPESWLEAHWREGDFKLETAGDVREFMLNQLGNLGFAPVRELGPFERVKFKKWDAWQVKVRGQFLRYDGQWMIFYVPEANKAYAIGTTVVQPPSGIDAHAFLRDGFEVHPEMNAEGLAPEPLPRLLPPPELISPGLGARFIGIDQPIILMWKPVKELAEDEYYLVSVDYNYVEANPRLTYVTREIQFTLPVSLYNLPNCGIFNWRITLMRRTSVSENGQLKGEPISFNSLCWYVQWNHPYGEEVPFKPLCPNPQF